MDRKISIQDLAQSLSQSKRIPLNQAEKFVRTYFETISQYVIQEKSVKVKGLGTFKLVEVLERESVNVSSGQRFTIPGHSKVSFTPDATLKDTVNKPFADFQTVIINEGTSIKDMERITTANIIPSEEVVENVTEISEVIESEQNVAKIQENAESLPAENESETAVSVQEESIPTPADSIKSNIDEELEEKESAVSPKSDESQNTNDNSIETMSTSNKNYSASIGRTIGWGALILLLIIGSYFAGYYKLFTSQAEIRLEIIKVQPEPDKESDTTDPTRDVHTPDVQANKSLPDQAAKSVTPLETREDYTSKYPQVPGGKYLIVGVKKVRKMRVGDNLFMMAKQELGNKNFAQYIIVLNNFQNPDCIPLNYDVLIPELKENN